MNIQLGDGTRNGMNFSDYSKLRLEVEYIGAAEKLRMFFRNVVSDPDVTQDSKYHEFDIPIRNGAYLYEIPLDNFKVALWWLGSENLIGVAEQHVPHRDNELNRRRK